MRSGSGIDRATDPVRPAARPIVERPSFVGIEDAGPDGSFEEGDPFQWFVDLFVAEYALEAKATAARTVPPAADRSG